MAAEDAYGGHGPTGQQSDVRGTVFGVNLGHWLGEDPVFRPGEHEPGDRQEHGGQIVGEGYRGTRHDGHGQSGGEQIAQQARGADVARLRFLRHKLVGHGVIDRPGEQHVIGPDDPYGQPRCQG